MTDHLAAAIAEGEESVGQAELDRIAESNRIVAEMTLEPQGSRPAELPIADQAVIQGVAITKIDREHPLARKVMCGAGCRHCGGHRLALYVIRGVPCCGQRTRTWAKRSRIQVMAVPKGRVTRGGRR